MTRSQQSHFHVYLLFVFVCYGSWRYSGLVLMPVAIKQGNAGYRAVRESESCRRARFKKSVCKRIQCQSWTLTLKANWPQLCSRWNKRDGKWGTSRQAESSFRQSCFHEDKNRILFGHSQWILRLDDLPSVFYWSPQCSREKGCPVLIHLNVSPPSYTGKSSSPPRFVGLEGKDPLTPVPPVTLVIYVNEMLLCFDYMSSDSASIFCGLTVRRSQKPGLRSFYKTLGSSNLLPEWKWILESLGQRDKGSEPEGA